MAWESDQEEAEVGRDWSKLLWYAITLVVVGMLVWMFVPKGGVEAQSRVRAWHILIPAQGSDPEDRDAALSQALDLRQRILDGEDFSSLASEYSSDEYSAAKGGDLGWVRHGELTDEVDAFIWSAPMNEISEVIPTGYGYHLVLVTDRIISDAEQYERTLHERVLEDSSGTSQP